MLQNAYFLAKIGADTAENKQHFADGELVAARGGNKFRRPARGRRGTKRARRYDGASFGVQPK